MLQRLLPVPCRTGPFVEEVEEREPEAVAQMILGTGTRTWRVGLVAKVEIVTSLTNRGRWDFAAKASSAWSGSDEVL
eukprot:symbB.v1.2.029449.t1/scaffold3186.1/size61749/2